MAITREKKTELLELYKKHIQQSSALVFTNFRGMPVPRLASLRARLGEQDTSYMVVKNSIFAIALQESGLPQPEELLTGPKAVAFVGEDIGRGVKGLTDWIKAEKIGEISGALLGTSVLDTKSAEALADLPTQEEVLASILGTINAPASSLVRMLNAPGASLTRVINAYVEKQQETEAA